MNRALVASLISTTILLVVPAQIHAFSRTDVLPLLHSLVCTIRGAVGFPCGGDSELVTVSTQTHAVPDKFVPPLIAAAVTAFASSTSAQLNTALVSEPQPQHEGAEHTFSSPEAEYVGRTEFTAVTDSLRDGLHRALVAAQEQTIPLVQSVAPPQTQALFVSAPYSGGGSRNYDADIASLWRALSLTNKIDTLQKVTITDSTFSGSFDGTFTGTFITGDVSASTLSLSGGFVGTSIRGSSLTITGTSTAATTTSAILDTRGQVCNVQAYGAVGNDSTDNYTAIMSAINACPMGGIVFFPPGIYRISQSIVLDVPVTLQGTYAPRWTYSAAPRTSIKPTPTFSGTNIIHVRDKSLSGQASDNNGGRITNITIDGNSYGSGINGIYFEGLVRDWKLQNVDITQTSGDGFEAAEGGGSGNPRGFTIEHLAIYSPASHGFRATALNDTYMEDVLVVGGAQRGFYLSSMGETKISNSRAVFNALEGLYIDGSTTNGGLQISNFSTDRNDRHGVRISATGTTTIAFDNLLTRRDGPNDGSGSEAPYAGVAIMGTAGSPVAPVTIKNLTQIPGRNDAGVGTAAPATGIRAEYASYVSIDGVLWGVTSPYTNGGNNTYFFIGEESLLKTGFTNVSTTIYNKKWMIATSTTGLVYTAGSIGIGTTSPTAQLHTTGTVRLSGLGAGTLQTDASGNVSAFSDERLKTIEGDFLAGLDAILLLRPITYHWNEASGLDTQTLYAGFSAQNVKAAIPEAVGEDSRGFLTLSDRPILAAVVTALQKMWETITGHSQKIEELEQRIRILEESSGIHTPPSTPQEVVSTTPEGQVNVATSSDPINQSPESASSSVPVQNVEMPTVNEQGEEVSAID